MTRKVWQVVIAALMVAFIAIVFAALVYVGIRVEGGPKPSFQTVVGD